MITVFVFCWSPYAALSAGSLLGYSKSIPVPVTVFPLQMAKSSTLWNPLIFFILNPTFRKSALDELPEFLRKKLMKREESRNVTSVATQDRNQGNQGNQGNLGNQGRNNLESVDSKQPDCRTEPGNQKPGDQKPGNQKPGNQKPGTQTLQAKGKHLNKTRGSEVSRNRGTDFCGSRSGSTSGSASASGSGGNRSKDGSSRRDSVKFLRNSRLQNERSPFKMKIQNLIRFHRKIDVTTSIEMTSV
ncbi:melanopsin [Eurytemora carolleeae]|uniref:melanopsin n=1 Tax=Eurytemora carolleeae TaxID=1294199 RepID=UPI000C7652A5|nr:melanopsin [Eurytemora carolleeae]|eukprot:XP_023347274.1 melanopsin-like [Eurytemora affinis]